MRDDKSYEHLPIILDGKFFKIVKEDSGKAIAKCVNCYDKRLSGAMNATSNFLRHLRNEHESIVSQYESYKRGKTQKGRKGRKRKNSDCSSSNSCTLPRLPNASDRGDPDYQPNQSTVSGDDGYFVADNSEQLGILFRLPGELTQLNESAALSVKCLSPGAMGMSRNTLADRIDARWAKMRSELKAELRKAEVVCTTADVWSFKKKSHFIMTVHWLSSSLHRKSAALACQRLRYGDVGRIADLIHEVHDGYGLDRTNVAAMVTDSVGNFGKAISEYMSVDDVREEDEEMDSEGERELSRMDGRTHEYEDLGEVLYIADALNIQLPDRVRCACHSLDRIVEEAMENVPSPIGTIGKCCRLLSSISENAYKVSEICEVKKLMMPNPTTFKSQYDGVGSILEQMDKMDQISEVLEEEKFSGNDIEFMVDYKISMEPFAVALDQLQGDENCYYGVMLPALMQLKCGLQNIPVEKDTGLCFHFVKLLREGLSKRFMKFFTLDLSERNVKESVLAAVTHPLYKLKWVAKVDRESVVRLFLDDAERFSRQLSEAVAADEPMVKTIAEEDDEETFKPGNGGSEAEMQLQAYLSDETCTVQNLDRYGIVKKMFTWYNTTLPSSWPVERLFSRAGSIERPRKSKLPDAALEKLTLLKLNKDFL